MGVSALVGRARDQRVRELFDSLIGAQTGGTLGTMSVTRFEGAQFWTVNERTSMTYSTIGFNAPSHDLLVFVKGRRVVGFRFVSFSEPSASRWYFEPGAEMREFFE